MKAGVETVGDCSTTKEFESGRIETRQSMQTTEPLTWRVDRLHRNPWSRSKNIVSITWKCGLLENM